MSTNKLQDYKEKMLKFLQRSFPNMEFSDVEAKLDQIIEERDSQKSNIEFDIKFFDQVSRDVNDVPLNKLESFMHKKGHVLTKYGTAYTQHAKKEALESKMLDASGKRRKKAKKQKFEHINDPDPTLMKMFDCIQLTYKTAIMNSYYGVLTAGGSIFRDLDCGESVTASGEEIIMTAIDTFEKFLMENVHFYTASDVITYITNIIEEEYESEIIFGITKEQLIGFLENHFYTKDDIRPIHMDLNEHEAVINFVDTLTQEEIDKVYYKNRLYKFLKDSEIYKEFDKIFSREIPFLNPNGPNNLSKSEMGNKELEELYKKEWEYNQAVLEDVWFYVKDWVFYNHIDINKFNFCKKGKRRSVLVVDTDSNFLHLEPAYNFFKENIKKVDNSKEMKVASINCITYLITKVINEAYLKFGELHFVEEKYRPLVNMKNEFMLSRLLMTKNKKSYASSVLMQEGNLIAKQKIDLKGLAIKKSNTNKFVSEYFTNLLRDDIILAKEINYSNIIRKYFNLIDIIKESFNKGETTFTIPSRANEIEGYANPVNVMQLRGILTWNIIYPENEITLPTNVNVVKLVIEENMEENKEKIISYCNKNKLKYNKAELDSFLEKLNEAFNLSYSISKDNVIEHALVKGGIINVISMPKNLNEIPIFLRPFLDTEKMVYDHLNSGTIILDCLNIQTPKVNENLIPTNIIKI